MSTETRPQDELFAEAQGSATLAKYRAGVAHQIKDNRQWLDWLEKDMKRDPDGVIPWIVVESILRAANILAYEAGRVNGVRMEETEAKSPNAPDQLPATGDSR